MKQKRTNYKIQAIRLIFPTGKEQYIKINPLQVSIINISNDAPKATKKNIPIKKLFWKFGCLKKQILNIYKIQVCKWYTVPVYQDTLFLKYTVKFNTKVKAKGCAPSEPSFNWIQAQFGAAVGA